MIIGARGDDLSNRGVDRAVRARVRIGAQCVGVAAPGHHAALLGLAARQHRQQRRHRLRGTALRLAAKGHEQRERADRRVEALVRIVAPEQIDELIKYVDLQMADSTASWHMQADGTYVRHCKDEEGRPLVDSQEYLIKKHTRRPVRH